MQALHESWAEALRSAYGPIPVVPWAVQERKLAAALALELGADMADRMIRHVVSTWSKRDRWGGFPSLRLIYAARQELAIEMEVGRGRVTAGKSPPSAKERNLMRGEFDPISAAKSPKIGW